MKNYFVFLILFVCQIVAADPFKLVSIPFFRLENADFAKETQKAETLIQQDPELKFLLPEKFVILDNNDDLALIHYHIRKTIYSLLETKTGSILCSELMQGDSNLFKNHFGFPMKFSHPSQAVLCRYGPSLDRNFITPEASSFINIRPKKYYVILYDNPIQSTPAQSWTGSSNSTYLFLNKSSFDPFDFTRIIAHELSISYLSESRAPLTMKPTCDQLALFEHPYIKLAFRIYRAFKVENSLLTELGYAPVGNFSNCTEDMATMLKETENYSVLLNSQMLEYTYNFSRKCPLHPALAENDLSSLFETIKNDPEMCKYLSASGEFVDVNNHNPKGPRPPIGSGSGTTPQQKSETTKTTESVTFSKNQKNQSDIMPVLKPKADPNKYKFLFRGGKEEL